VVTLDNFPSLLKYLSKNYGMHTTDTRSNKNYELMPHREDSKMYFDTVLLCT